MIIKIKRIFKGDSYTIGKLYINDIYECDTLEDKVRDLTIEDKVSGETAIPPGKYQMIINFSNRFQKQMPLLLNVPNFEGIRIHNGNTDKHTDGCILLGKNKVKGKVLDSVDCFNIFMKKVQIPFKKGEKIWIIIE